MYLWPRIFPELHSSTSHCLLSVSTCRSHGHIRCYLLTTGHLIFTIKPVLHPHPHLCQLSKSTQLPRNLGVALNSSLFLTLDIQPIRKSQLFCFQSITCLHLSCYHLAHTIHTSCMDNCTYLPSLRSPSHNPFSTQQLQRPFKKCKRGSVSPLLGISHGFPLPLESNLRPFVIRSLPPPPSLPLSFSLHQATGAFSGEQVKPFLSPGLCTCCSFCLEPLFPLLHVVASFLPLRSELKCHQHHFLSKAFSKHFSPSGSSPLSPNLKAITSLCSSSLSAHCNLKFLVVGGFLQYLGSSWGRELVWPHPSIFQSLGPRWHR